MFIFTDPSLLEAVIAAFPNLEKRRKARAGTLSGGEQQATAIGRALMTNPELLLLDEVSLGLSPLAVDRVYASLATLMSSGTTIILVEQDLSRALKVADRVMCMLEGRIATAVGEPGESVHKSRLQELTVRLGRGVPLYEVQGSGPDHARRYLATVYVAGQRLGTGDGRSKKDAEQVAAQVACEALEVERGGGNA